MEDMSEKSDVAGSGPCGGQEDDVAYLLDQIEALTWDLERTGSPGSRFEKEVARQQLRLRVAAAARRAAKGSRKRRLTDLRRAP